MMKLLEKCEQQEILGGQDANDVGPYRGPGGTPKFDPPDRKKKPPVVHIPNLPPALWGLWIFLGGKQVQIEP